MRKMIEDVRDTHLAHDKTEKEFNAYLDKFPIDQNTFAEAQGSPAHRALAQATILQSMLHGVTPDSQGVNRLDLRTKLAELKRQFPSIEKPLNTQPQPTAVKNWLENKGEKSGELMLLERDTSQRAFECFLDMDESKLNANDPTKKVTALTAEQKQLRQDTSKPIQISQLNGVDEQINNRIDEINQRLVDLDKLYTVGLEKDGAALRQKKFNELLTEQKAMLAAKIAQLQADLRLRAGNDPSGPQKVLLNKNEGLRAWLEDLNGIERIVNNGKLSHKKPVLDPKTDPTFIGTNEKYPGYLMEYTFDVHGRRSFATVKDSQGNPVKDDPQILAETMLEYDAELRAKGIDPRSVYTFKSNPTTGEWEIQFHNTKRRWYEFGSANSDRAENKAYFLGIYRKNLAAKPSAQTNTANVKVKAPENKAGEETHATELQTLTPEWRQRNNTLLQGLRDDPKFQKKAKEHGGEPPPANKLK